LNRFSVKNDPHTVNIEANDPFQLYIQNVPNKTTGRRFTKVFIPLVSRCTNLLK
jgi:hypothetical protein